MFQLWVICTRDISLVAVGRRTEVGGFYFCKPYSVWSNEDFSTYPRDERRDLGLLEAAGADIVFIPTVEEMYPSGNVTDITVKSRLTKILCAKSRPTHFDGVTNLGVRLFCLVKPDYAFFGRKDVMTDLPSLREWRRICELVQR